MRSPPTRCRRSKWFRRGPTGSSWWCRARARPPAGSRRSWRQLDAELAPDVRESIGYAFRELLLNAVEWGGKLDPSRTVRISCLRAKRMLMYRIADPGPGFNIEDLPHAAIGQPSDDPIAHMEVREAKGIRPGGFGLLMVRASVDELLYNEKRNEVVFVKYLDGTKTGPAVRVSPKGRRQPGNTFPLVSLVFVPSSPRCRPGRPWPAPACRTR